MKIAVVSEFTADEAAVKILADSILGIETELVASRRWRPRGWPSVLNLLPTIIKDLHYNTNADGLIMVVDSDDTSCHDRTHETGATENAACRLCQLRIVANRESQRLSTIVNREQLKFAIGLAVPAIEAWYRCGVDPHVNEATWVRRLAGERITYDKTSLKKASYGSERAPLGLRIEKAKEAAERLKGDLDLLDRLFPNGFGCLRRDLRAWLE
jgi:hypothetical protein